MSYGAHTGEKIVCDQVNCEQGSFCLYNTSTRVPSPFSIVPSFSAFFPRSPPSIHSLPLRSQISQEPGYTCL